MIYPVLPNMSDNYEFHKREYIMIRPWITNLINQMDIECKPRANNQIYFLLNDSFEISNPIDMEQIVQNENATEFIKKHIEEYNFNSPLKLIDIMRHNQNAIRIIRPMLDALCVFIKYVSLNEKMNSYISEDSLIKNINSDDGLIIDSGITLIKQLYKELANDNLTFNQMIKTIAKSIGSSPASTDYLKQNRIFIDHKCVCLNKKWKELITAKDMLDSDIWWCFNEGAWELAHLVDANNIEWDMLLTFCNNNDFIKNNLHRYDLNDEITLGNIIGNKHLVDLIYTHTERMLTYKHSEFIKYNASYNPSLIFFLEENKEFVNEGILENPNLITYDYQKILNEKKDLRHELIEFVHQPRFIQKWIDSGNDIETYLN